MAKEIREKKVIRNLGKIVDNNIASFVASRNRVRANKSADFYRKVVDEGLGAEEQRAFFEGWLKEEKDRGVVDNSFISELKTNISDLKKIERSNKFYDKYRQSFEAFKVGRKGIGEHIEYLESQLKSATDYDLRIEIQNLLTKAKTDKITIDNNILTNQVNLAINDKRESTLLGAMAKVKKAKNKAIAGNNLEAASAYDLKIQALNSQLQSTRITDEVHKMDIDMMNKPFTPTMFLDEMTKRINMADNSETPITINGKRYDNAKQYWQMQTNDYIEKDFFRLLQDDYKSEVDNADLKLKPVLEAKIKEQFNELNSLKTNSILEPFVSISTIQNSASWIGINAVSK